MSLPEYKDEIFSLIECNLGECFDTCPNQKKRTEANVFSFLWDIFDAVELSSCKDSDKLNGVCVDGIERDKSLLFSLGDIINIGYCTQEYGFMGEWDYLFGNPYLCPLAQVNGLEE